MTIGEQVKAHRHRLGLTQQQLADKCQKSRSYVALIESDRRQKNDDLIELFSALGLTIKLEPKNKNYEKKDTAI